MFERNCEFFSLVLLLLACKSASMNDYDSVAKKHSSDVASKNRNSYFKVTALVDKSVTLTCSIDLDDREFSKNGNYKIIWSREIENGKDFEPLALDDTRLIQDTRINPTRMVINKQNVDQIQWNLVINDLKLVDSNNYICQLNKKPYDAYWLRKFTLNVYEPASFIDENEKNESNAMTKYENSIFEKSVNEFDDFKLKCNARGKPKPKVIWFLRYLNGTQIQLHVDNDEIIIKNIKRTSKIDRVECQLFNGYGATVTRSFKINIKHKPYTVTKSKVYRVPLRTNEIKLNCTVNANPVGQIQWFYLSADRLKSSLNARYEKLNMNKYDYGELELDDDWKSINQVAAYSFKHTNSNHHNHFTSDNSESSKTHQNNSQSQTSILKIPLSKYQIYEKRNHNHVESILFIKSINERDYGLYRCVSSNDLGNRSIDFKIQELNHESMNSEKMRSILNKEKEFTRLKPTGEDTKAGDLDDYHEEDTNDPTYTFELNTCPSLSASGLSSLLFTTLCTIVIDSIFSSI